MNDILALIVTIIGALLFLVCIGGGIYIICEILRDAQKKDKEIDEFNKKFKQGR